MPAIYLVSGSAAASSVGLTCRTGDAGADPSITFALAGIASRIAAVMNVATLLPVTTTDYFDVGPAPSAPRTTDRRLAYGMGLTPYVTQKLRLSNGLVDPTTVSISGPSGDPFVPFSDPQFNGTRQFIDSRLGIVEINSPWDVGQYAVTYSSGLPVFVDPDNPRDPDSTAPYSLDTSSEPWLNNAVGLLLKLFNITAGSTKIQEGLRFDAVDAAIRTELTAYLMQCYERPRYAVTWASYSRNVV